MSFQLQGKNALVSGSTDGIGEATAIVLAELGANITLLARNEAKLEQVLRLLPVSQTQKHDYLVGDFFEAEAVGQTVTEYLKKKQGHFHILINNTGGPPIGPLIDKTGGDLLKCRNLDEI